MSPLALAILLPLLPGAAACVALGRRRGPWGRRASAFMAGAVALSVLALLLGSAPAVLSGHPIMAQWSWVPELGLDVGLRLDGLSLVFAVLISAMGVLVVTYAHAYLGPDDPPGPFFGLLMVFMGAMLGIALSDNLLILVVFWELTSLSSFLLVGYRSQQADARAGARMALAITGGGGLLLLAGAILLGQMAGTHEISEMVGRAAAVRADERYPIALLLIVLGCFAKSAQWPFHIWLPGAMAAPTPVSAYLHSATMVKAGVFLLARLSPVIGGTGLFEGLVGGGGLVTLCFAAVVALFRHDLKGMLAYSTISHLGLITFLIGLSTPLASLAAVFHTLNHATFKAALFMTAGIVDHETGTRDMRRLGGLMQFMPITATLAMVASASMAGLPLLNGFISKEMFFEQTLAVQARWAGGWLLPLLAMAAAACSVACSIRLVQSVLLGEGPRGLPASATPHDPPWPMWLPVAALSALCLGLGLFPEAAVGTWVRSAAAAMHATPFPDVPLSLWHGLNVPFMMSLVALLGGALLTVGLQKIWQPGARERLPGSGRRVFGRSIERLTALADAVISRLDQGSLQVHVAVVLVTTLVLGAWPLWGHPLPLAGSRELLEASPLSVAVWALAVGSSLAVVLLHRTRFVAVLLAGAVGLATAVTFLGLSAPDLALTQLTVEVVSTALLLMGLSFMPARAPRESSPLRRWRDGMLAGLGGLAVAWLCWIVLTHDQDTLSGYFLAQSLPQGGGRNIVNVILVDFRGFDTFGEITVLAIAAVAVMALLEAFRVSPAFRDAQGRVFAFARKPLLLRTAAAFILPVGLLVALHIFWRGHQEPGGGFVAGLITASVLLLQHMAQGQSRTEAWLDAQQGARHVQWIVAGLGLALFTGMGAFAWRQPFLTSAHGHPILPWLGEIGLASAALFDLGVCVTVVGATLLLLSSMSRVGTHPEPSA